MHTGGKVAVDRALEASGWGIQPGVGLDGVVFTKAG
jgi:hypothetical protein